MSLQIYTRNIDSETLRQDKLIRRRIFSAYEQLTLNKKHEVYKYKGFIS